MPEHRRLLRRDTSLRGEIVVGLQHSIRCIVRNVSDSGAKLDLDAAVTVPPAFQLRAADLGLDVEATTVWRDGSEMGVQFHHPPGNA